MSFLTLISLAMKRNEMPVCDEILLRDTVLRLLSVRICMKEEFIEG